MKNNILHISCLFFFFLLFISCYSDLKDEVRIEEWNVSKGLPSDGNLYPFSLLLTVSDVDGNDLINHATPNYIDTLKMKIFTLKEDGSWEQRKDSVYYDDWPAPKTPHITPLYICRQMVSPDSGLEFNLIELPPRIGPRVGCLSHTYWIQWDENRSDTITFRFDHPFTIMYEDAFPSAMYINGKEEKPIPLVHLIH